jgi:Ca2+-binding EF-hand superfamily protein
MEKYDKNKDGKIDDKEKEAIREAFRQRASEWMKERTEKGAAHIIVELDKNKDGKLNADEVPEKYREHFGETDKNGDGYIDEAELTKALEAAREKMLEHVKQRMEEHRKRHGK